jgi:hypothetical protein
MPSFYQDRLATHGENSKKEMRFFLQLSVHGSGGGERTRGRTGRCRSGTGALSVSRDRARAWDCRYVLRGICSYVMALRFKLGGRPVLSAHLNVETARFKRNGRKFMPRRVSKLLL